MRTIQALLLLLCCSPFVRGEETTLPETKTPEVKKEEPKKDAAKKDDKKYTTAEMGCMHCAFNAADAHVPGIKIDGKIYYLRAIATADEKTKKAIESVAGKEKVVKVKVVGKPAEENKENWYFVGELMIDD